VHGLPPQTPIPKKKVKFKWVKTKYKNPVRSSGNTKAFHVKEKKRSEQAEEGSGRYRKA
jgi:hypothetical protein